MGRDEEQGEGLAFRRWFRLIGRLFFVVIIVSP